MTNRTQHSSRDGVLLAIGCAINHAPAGTGWNKADVPTLAEALDFTVSNHGTIHLLQPLSEAAEDWVEHHIPDDATRFDSAIVIEHRYIKPILHGLERDGLSAAYK